MPLAQTYQQLLDTLQGQWHLNPLQSQLFSAIFPFAFAALAILLALYITWILAQWALAPIIKSLARRIFRPHLLNSYSFLEVTFPARTSKSNEATSHLLSQIHHAASSLSPLKALGLLKTRYSLEIASTPDGTRYIIRIPRRSAEAITSSLLAYEPSLIIKLTPDYWPKQDNLPTAIAEMRLSSDFALPLKSHARPADYDPLAYLTSQMAKSGTGHLSAYQIILSPLRLQTHSRTLTRLSRLRRRIAQNAPLSPELTGLGDLPRLLIATLRLIAYTFMQAFLFALSILMIFLPGPDKPGWSSQKKKGSTRQHSLSPSEQELTQSVRTKLDQPLFETTIRLVATGPTLHDAKSRLQSLASTLSPFTSYPQSLTARINWPGSKSRRLNRFKDRRHSPEFLRLNPVLSTGEIASLYHFPLPSLHPQGLSKSRSRQLPSPTIPNSRGHFDVILGKTRYGGTARPIGLTLEQRRRHTYIIGKTGTGKTTLMTGAIYQDMLSGNGLAVLDPHGDMFKNLLGLVPIHRHQDVVVFDPADGDWPVGLNILNPGIDFQTKEDRDEWVTSAVISVFQKLSDERYWGPKMEHILRNTTLTALKLPDPTLYTIQQLLTSRSYRKEAVKSLDDPILKAFWLQEFALMGSMQLSAAISPLTQRLGQFLTSPRARNILMQPMSTINIQDIMDNSKILLINLAKGELGEDQSRFFGTLITALIWMGAYQRARQDPNARPDFFLYIDEFQNFATARFADIASEGRKFGLALTTAHQNVAQIKDQQVLQTITANASTLICLEASPDDEDFIIPFMRPDVTQGDITNLEPHQFFMKTSGPNTGTFSGETMELAMPASAKVQDAVIASSRNLYAMTRTQAKSELDKVLRAQPQSVTKLPQTPRRRLQPAFLESLEVSPSATPKNHKPRSGK